MSIVNSYNLFIDTERNLSQESNGQEINLPLGQTPITCGTDQFVRLTLQEFTMYKSWNSVNNTNSGFRVALPSVKQVAESLIEGNYNSFFSLLENGLIDASNNKLKTAIDALDASKVVLSTEVLNPDTGNAGNTDNVAQIKVTYTGAHGYTNDTAPIMQFFVEDGKSYQLLGGKRIRGNANSNLTSKSWNTTVLDTSSIILTGYYSGQIATQTHAYLRINEQNTNIATSAFDQVSNVDTRRTEMGSSNILGIIPITSSWMRYVAQSDMVYFTNIISKQVTQLRIRITDSNGNFFPLMASGQAEDGNRSFTAVIRVDTVLLPSSIPHSINNPSMNETTQPRFSSAPRTQIGHLESNGLNGATSGYYGDGFVGVTGQRIS